MSSNIVYIYIYFHKNQSEISPPHFISHSSKSWLVGFWLGKCISSRHRFSLPEADAKLRRKLACRAARAEAAGFVGEATEPPAAEVQLKERPLKEQKILGLDGKFVGCQSGLFQLFFSAILLLCWI